MIIYAVSLAPALVSLAAFAASFFSNFCYFPHMTSVELSLSLCPSLLILHSLVVLACQGNCRCTWTQYKTQSSSCRAHTVLKGTGLDKAVTFSLESCRLSFCFFLSRNRIKLVGYIRIRRRDELETLWRTRRGSSHPPSGL
jgi:hypothetical protein